MDPADQRAQLVQDRLGLLVRLRDERCGRSGFQAGQAQRHRQREQPLLYPVVQVPLDPPPLVVEPADQARPGSGQLGQPGAVRPGYQQRPGQRRTQPGQRRHPVRQRHREDDAEQRYQPDHAGVREPRPVGYRGRRRDRDHDRREQGEQAQPDRPDHHGQLQRPQQHPGEQRERQLLPGGRLPQPGREPAAWADRPVRRRRRPRVDQPQPAPLHGADGHAGAERGERHEQQREDADRYAGGQVEERAPGSGHPITVVRRRPVGRSSSTSRG